MLKIAMDGLAQQLIELGLTAAEAEQLATQLSHWQKELTPEACWQRLQMEYLNTSQPFELHNFLYKTIYADVLAEDGLAPAWFPSEDTIARTNLSQLMNEYQLVSVKQAHAWSVENHELYYAWLIKKLNIQFAQPYSQICDLSAGVTQPKWLPGAKFNIIDSCLQADPQKIAVIHQSEDGEIYRKTYGELSQDVNKLASAIQQRFKPETPIAIDLPMTYESVVAYLAVIKSGCTVVSIADSFAPEEIRTRLDISKAQAIFTQDVILRGGKSLPLYDKVKAADAALAIVLITENNASVTLRDDDITWHDFIANANTNANVKSIMSEAGHAINILFSSGTTGEPKALPWTQATAISVAVESFFHHDIHDNDIIAWPTNLGWMMGPWLLFVSLLNGITMALYDGIPTARGFGKFIANAEVTILGLVPSIVNAWRSNKCIEGLDWSNIKLFSSTGECSNSEDMLYLMYLANYKPIIEYCGGTEVGGTYISSTILQPNVPATFNTPTLGIDFRIIDEAGKSTEYGEVALLPPAMGLSTTLLNRDHYKEYYADMPPTPSGRILRRHGDQAQDLGHGYYRLLGRVDDTMNLGGIKTSSADIERTLVEVSEVHECAAIGVNPAQGGPTQLVLYCVPAAGIDIAASDNSLIQGKLQDAIKQHLNPLFKVHDVVLVPELPRTASNKIMRRVLRRQYRQQREESK